jgi:hypothetical protein
MIGPEIFAGIEQKHRCARDRIDASEVRPLLPIAFRAAQREVCGIIAAPVLTGHDVIDIESRRVCRLREPAIFASVVGAFNYKTAVGSVNHGQAADE